MIRLFLLVCCVASLSNCQSLSPSNCGLRPLAPKYQKIVNGVEAIPGDWGWSVSLSWNGRHFCGGVLITDEWVLTAAHCFRTGITASQIQVDIGVHDRFNKESWVISSEVSKVISNQFNPQFANNDISLVKLEKKITFDDTYIIPACLPESEDGSLNFDSNNQTAWLTGWGALFLNGQATIKKNQVSMEVQPNEKCKQIYGAMINPNAQICAGDFNDFKGPCQGDSGGPFVIEENGRWFVMGLISWGVDCGVGGVFTRVSYYLPWIKDKIANN